MNYEVFISYSRKDSDVAKRICNAFDSAGISYFIDKQGIGGGFEFPVVLAEAIIECKVVLFLASKNSYDSKFTNAELTFAFNEKPKNSVLPYIIDGSTMPPALRFVFSSINWRTIESHPIEPTLVDDILKLLGRTRGVATPTIIDKSREEAARKAREETERKAREEAERKAREEVARKAREEAERKAREEAERKAREEAERKAREEAARKAREEAARKAREEAERKAREEAARKAREEAARKAREEAERRAREEAERKAREEAARKAREEAEREARERAERVARMKKYSVGDYYNDGVREGVVFEVSAEGCRGKIVSLRKSAEMLKWASDAAEYKRLIGADSETNGAYNMAKVKTISGWRDKYPAFAWCADLGEGWYLPSKKELHILYNSRIILRSKLADNILDEYWSSTEPNGQSGDYFNAWVCSWYYSHDSYSYRKYTEHFVRAVATFGEDILEDDIRVFVEMERKAREEVERKVREAERNAREEAERKAQNKKYNIGDYYNDGVREGVVFEVTADGRHGKIVSMTESIEPLQWSSDSAEQKHLIGADSETDGAYNMAKVKTISGWRDKYPAFKWCADLGEGWYLPSIEELLTIYKNKERLILNLTGKLFTYGSYWSSTEDSYQYSSGEFCAWYMNRGYTNRNNKNNRYNHVRAVSAF